MELLIYLLKVSACTVLFFTFYILVLRKLTFFKINRFYLLLTLLLSFVIPTLNFTIEREVEATPIVYAQTEVADEAFVQEAISAVGSIETAPIIEESFDYYSLLPYLYFGIVFSLLFIATWRILKLFKYTKGIKHELNGLKIVQKSDGFTNCSFFNYVFIDENLNYAELQILLKHEEVHAKQFHSIDKIIMMLIKAFLWFNPVVYLYDQALEQAHEYEADEATSQNFGTEQYASLLLRLAISKSEMPLVHNFVKSPIKDRIKMLFNSKTKNMKKLMYLLALPIGLGLLWGFTVKVVDVSAKNKIDKQNLSSEKLLSLDKKLMGKTLKGQVKSIFLTEVGEVLNFKYDKGIIRVLNLPKGNVSVGDEVFITLGGIVNIQFFDAKGNLTKSLDGPCYGMDLMKTLDGAVLYKSSLQDTIKSQQQKNIDKIKKYEAFRKSPEFAKKLKEMENINGKTLAGVVGDNYGNDKMIMRKGKLLYADGKTYILESFTKGNIVNTLSKNDKIIIKVDYSSFNYEVPHLILSAKTITKDGKLLYTAPARPKPKEYAFLYEANKARYAWSIIKSIEKNNDGTINKIVLNDNGFTINLNVSDQKFKSENFKVGGSVIAKFFGEKLIAKNTYTTDKMIVLYSWPRKYELKNKELYDRFYNKDGTQKINKPFSKKPEVGKITSLKPILIGRSSLTVDTKTDIGYIKNGVMKIGDKQSKHTSKDLYQGKSDQIKYTAKDSIRTNNKTGDIYLYGGAVFESENMIFSSDQMVYNKAQNILKVKKNAHIFDKTSKSTVFTDSLNTNLKTGKGILFGKVFLNSGG